MFNYKGGNNMNYVDLGAELGKNYSSKETVKIISYRQFQTIKATVGYILKLSNEIGLPVPKGILEEDNLTAFILGFHNGTVGMGMCDPADAKLM